MADPGADPVFDRGMTARANGLPEEANPEEPGTAACVSWGRGWQTGEVRAVEIAEAAEPAETPADAA